MRKDIRDRGDRGKVKFRVIDFELEGSDESLQESLRSIVSAINRPAAAPPPRLLASNTTPARPAAAQPPPQQELFPEEARIEVEAESPQPEPAESEEARPARASNGQRKFYNPKILNDLDLKAGATPFAEFWAQKNPTEDSKRYLVILYWLKETLKLESVGADHIYTCYRTVKQNPPKDVGGPLRALKKKGFVVSGREKGTYAITHVGQDVVDQLGKDA